jgi:hypothetical protein
LRNATSVLASLHFARQSENPISLASGSIKLANVEFPFISAAKMRFAADFRVSFSAVRLLERLMLILRTWHGSQLLVRKGASESVA